jgi:serine/threonine-protein kinase RIO1
MLAMPFPPGARNEKAPARFLSGRTSAMIEACVKGGRVVNAFFCLSAGRCAKVSHTFEATSAHSCEMIVGSISVPYQADEKARRCLDQDLET